MNKIIFQAGFEKELKSAEEKKKVPEFGLEYLKIVSEENMVIGLKEIKIEMILKVDSDRHRISKDLKVVGHDGSIGLIETFNLLNECFCETLNEHFPSLQISALNAVASYHFHATSDETQKSSGVTVHLALGDKSAGMSVLNGGVDWSCAHALCRIYKWMLWRMLRAERGHARKMSQKKK